MMGPRELLLALLAFAVLASCALPHGSGNHDAGLDVHGVDGPLADGTDAPTDVHDIVDIVDIVDVTDVVDADAGCAPPQVSCSGACVDLATDRMNCGTCGSTCPSVLPNASGACMASACMLTCTTGFGDCDHTTTDGCEVTLSTDVANCGACGSACPPAGPHQHVSCTAGHCGSTCDTGFGDCDGLSSNGCETDLTSSAANCGSCGMHCSSLYCASSVCMLAPNCAAIHTSSPPTPSGLYTILPGSSAGIAYCDMDTDGGGWTLVFLATTSNYNDPNLDYTFTLPGLLAAAHEALIAYRSPPGNAAVGTWASFTLPTDWQTQSPFRYARASVAITANVGGISAPGTLWYGHDDVGITCGAAWLNNGNTWGRICVQGTNAPYYNGFASSNADYCPDSTQNANAAACTPTLAFSIAIR